MKHSNRSLGALTGALLMASVSPAALGQQPGVGLAEAIDRLASGQAHAGNVRALAASFPADDVIAALDDGAPFEQCLDAWHPLAHKALRLTNEQNLDRAARGLKGGSDLTSFGGVPIQALPLVHLVARVVTDQAIVWYGWAPELTHTAFMPPGSSLADRPIARWRIPYQPAPFGPAMDAPDGRTLGVVRIIEWRDDGGRYRLVKEGTPLPHSTQRVTRSILNDADLAKAIVHESLSMRK